MNVHTIHTIHTRHTIHTIHTIPHYTTVRPKSPSYLRHASWMIVVHSFNGFGQRWGMVHKLSSKVYGRFSPYLYRPWGKGEILYSYTHTHTHTYTLIRIHPVRIHSVLNLIHYYASYTSITCFRRIIHSPFQPPSHRRLLPRRRRRRPSTL